MLTSRTHARLRACLTLSLISLASSISISSQSFAESLNECLARYTAIGLRSDRPSNHSPNLKSDLDQVFESGGHLRQKTLLARIFGIERFDKVKNLDQAEILAEYFGIKELPEVKKLPPKTRLKLLNDIFSEIAKMPQAARDAIADANKRMDLVLGNITNHPDLASLKGVLPRGWKHVKWDDLPGCGSVRGPCTVIAADRLHEGHGSVNLVLHEHFHTYDSAYRELHGTTLSESQEFRSIWQKARNLPEYERDYENETFAESCAKFFNSPRSKKLLREKEPEIYDFIARHFGITEHPRSRK